jgi:hypothetical protein
MRLKKKVDLIKKKGAATRKKNWFRHLQKKKQKRDQLV